MDFSIQHVEVRVSSIQKAREFYVDTLGLEILDEIPQLNLIALKAGDVRISVFGGYERAAVDEKACGTHIIFRVPHLDAAIEQLKRRGVEFSGDIVEAGGFMRDIAMRDPDGNLIEIAEYLQDPLARPD